MAQTDQQRLERIEQLVQQWRAGGLSIESALKHIRSQAQEGDTDSAPFSGDEEIYDKGLG